MSTDQELFNRCAYALLSGGSAPAIERGPRVPHLTAILLRDLQRVERDIPPERWADELRRVAAAHNLKMPE